MISQEKPHIFGLSECELRRGKNFCDVSGLKIPGYDTLMPKSWSLSGFARLVVYVKSSLQYERCHDIEDDNIQSIWIKAGFRNTKKIFFCQFYREHTSSLGAAMKDQRIYLEKFLHQWEVACDRNYGGESPEIHLAGDMNIDAYNGRWYNKSYHLNSLAELVHSSCSINNLSQLVKEPTRYQFNSVTGQTSFSCIDHAYTTHEFRCSKVTTIPFGNSDHNALSYTRFAKDPKLPVRTIRRRSYKGFVLQDFLTDLRNVDWTVVYACYEVDAAVETFSLLFKTVLDRHAPFVTFQQRKSFTPWITPETLALMKIRDTAKSNASALSKNGLDSSMIWASYKKLRNQVNNRLKFEEKSFKLQKFSENAKSPAECWKTAKSFMNWQSSSGPPSQLQVNGNLISRASDIATEMNSFFINKVKRLRSEIPFRFNNFQSCHQIMKGKSCSLDLSHVSLEKVIRILKGLKSSKSTGLDTFDSYSIKVSAEIIAQPVHHLICLSIIQSKFPSA